MNTILRLSSLMLMCGCALILFGSPADLHAQTPVLEVLGETIKGSRRRVLTAAERQAPVVVLGDTVPYLIKDEVETIFLATLDGVPQSDIHLRITTSGIGDLRINGQEITGDLTVLTVNGLVAVSGEILVENGAFIKAEWKERQLTSEVRFIAEYVKEDVNQDGMVNILDLIAIANKLGSTDADSRADANRDGSVNVLDLLWVYKSHHWEKDGRTPWLAVAVPDLLSPPSVSLNVDLATIQSWIDLARVEDDGSALFDAGIAKLEALLAARKPNDTKLLLNYPNPFNPETWIPYQLAEATNVTVTIHAMNGSLIRTLALGHQTAGVYKSKSRAAYWDGHNEFGEQVASGLYFYTLTAGDFSATGKMLVRK